MPIPVVSPYPCHASPGASRTCSTPDDVKTQLPAPAPAQDLAIIDLTAHAGARRLGSIKVETSHPTPYGTATITHLAEIDEVTSWREVWHAVGQRRQILRMGIYEGKGRQLWEVPRKNIDVAVANSLGMIKDPHVYFQFTQELRD